MAHHSSWVAPVDRIEFEAGGVRAAALIYNQTNNIHAAMPIFTKVLERERERESERERVCVCMCVRERGCVCV